MWFFLIGLGCPAEQLGIELPPAGAGSIGMEDLLRDTRGAAGPDWATFVRARFADMRLRVEEGPALCGVRGRGAEHTFVAAAPGSVDDAAGVAVLIALAKAVDTSEAPGAWRFCVGDGPGTRVGPFPPGPLLDGRATSGPADPARRLEQLDYRELADKARAIWTVYGEGGASGTG